MGGAPGGEHCPSSWGALLPIAPNGTPGRHDIRGRPSPLIPGLPQVKDVREPPGARLVELPPGRRARTARPVRTAPRRRSGSRVGACGKCGAGPARPDTALTTAGFEEELKAALREQEVLGTDETPAPPTASGAAAEKDEGVDQPGREGPGLLAHPGHPAPPLPQPPSPPNPQRNTPDCLQRVWLFRSDRSSHRSRSHRPGKVSHGSWSLQKCRSHRLPASRFRSSHIDGAPMRSRRQRRRSDGWEFPGKGGLGPRRQTDLRAQVPRTETASVGNRSPSSRLVASPRAGMTARRPAMDPRPDDPGEQHPGPGSRCHRRDSRPARPCPTERKP